MRVALLRMMIVGEMTRSATWLLAAAIGAGLVGVVLKATDSLGPGSGTPADEPRTTRPDRADASLDADGARSGGASSAPASAARSRERADESEVDHAPRDLPVPAPGGNAVPDDVGPERARPRGTIGSHRSARGRSNPGRSSDGGSLHAGAVGGDPGARLEPLATGSTRAAGQPAGPLAANPAASGNERATPDVAPTASDVTFTSGDERQFPTDMPVEVSDMPEIAGGSGTLSFWLQPTWEGDNQDDASLLELGDGRLRVVKNVDFLRFEWMDDAGTSGGIGAPIVDWKPGEWHAVTTTWNGSSFALYIDGRLVSAKDDAGRVGLPADSTLVIGSNFAESRPVAPGVIGKVDVRRRPLSPAEVAN
ncbi:MAG TPA: LamG domain-containing protein, partial [Candidatus Binatus sp.]|nr:LamG domain-containing protein [Candidatus Binatus sp.]